MSRIRLFALWALLLISAAGIWYVSLVLLDGEAGRLLHELHRSWPTADTSVRGQVGEFFNARFGLPLTVVGAAVGTVLTGVGLLFTSRQGDVELLNFVEKRLTATTDNYGEMADRMGHLAWISNTSIDLVQELLPLLLEAMDEEGVDDAWDAVEAILERPDLEELQLFVLAMAADLQATARQIGVSLREIGRDFYAEAFRARQLKEVRGAPRPLPYLAGLGLPANLLPARLLDENPHVLAENLIGYSETTRLGHFVGAYLITPNTVTAQDHLGHAILPIILTLKEPRLHRGRIIEGYTLNVGCAYLVTLAAMLPTRKIIRAVFHQLFEGRAHIAMRFLKIAGPDRALFGSPYVMASLVAQLERPERLVIVRLSGGEAEFYDPHVHGEIPRRGYEGERLGTETLEI